MTEFELKQKISEALSWADIYSALNSLSFFIALIAAFATFGLVLNLYAAYENRDKDVIPFLVKLLVISFSFFVVFIFTTIFTPSKDSKIAEAQAYISELKSTPQNDAYIYALNKQYDILSKQDFERTIEEAVKQRTETKKDVAQSEEL